MLTILHIDNHRLSVRITFTTILAPLALRNSALSGEEERWGGTEEEEEVKVEVDAVVV